MKERTEDGFTGQESPSRPVDRRELLRRIRSGKKKRRSFLGQTVGVIGSIFGTISGLSRSADGLSPDKRERMAVAREYHSKDVVRRAIDNHASAVLRELDEKEYLASPSVAELPVQKLHDSITEFADASEGTMVFGTHVDGDATPRIEVRKSLSSGSRLVVVVMPELDHSFAVIQDGRSPTHLGAVGTAETISPSDDCVACFHDEKCLESCGTHACECLTNYLPEQCAHHCCYTGGTCCADDDPDIDGCCGSGGC